MNIDFFCDTEDCVYWSEEDGCKKTAITILEHCCCDYEKKVYEYCLIAGLPPLLSEVYVTSSGGLYHKARFLGYGAYDKKKPVYKTYCVEVMIKDGHTFVGFYRDIYSRRWKESR